MQQIEDAVGQYHNPAATTDVFGKGSGVLLGDTCAGRCSHSPVMRMPLEKVQRCGGRKIPVSFTFDATRIAYSCRW